MKLPTVSIITPSLNQAQFIEQTILSIMEQEYPEIDHIIIDGGSNDGTSDIIKKYENKYNLRWLSEPDKGQSDAINKGFKMAKGQIIGWLNSDDTYKPRAVHSAVETLLESRKIGWVYGDSEFINESGDVIREWKARPYNLATFITEGQFMAQPTIFFRSEMLKKIGFIDTTMHYAMDTDFFTRMAIESPGHYIPKVLATRRIHRNAKTKSNITAFALDRLNSLNKLFAMEGLSLTIRNLKNLAYSNAFYFAAARYYEAGLYIDSRYYCVKYLRTTKNKYRKVTIKILLIYLQTLLGVHFYTPGKTYYDK